MNDKFPSNSAGHGVAPQAKRRLVRIGLVALGFAVVGFLLSPYFTFGPLHRGKPIRYSTDLACGPHGHRFQLEVKQIGSPAVPYLVAKLHTKDTWLRTTWMDMHEKLPDRLSGFVTELLPAYDVHSAKADTKAAIPALNQLLNNDSRQVRQIDAEALRQIHPLANEPGTK